MVLFSWVLIGVDGGRGEGENGGKARWVDEKGGGEGEKEKEKEKGGREGRGFLYS